MSLDPDALFDDDYLYFYEQLLTPERSDDEAELIWRLGELGPGSDVLDAPCGHGRLSNRLAGRGCRVTGLDRSEASSRWPWLAGSSSRSERSRSRSSASGCSRQDSARFTVSAAPAKR